MTLFVSKVANYKYNHVIFSSICRSRPLKGNSCPPKYYFCIEMSKRVVIGLSGGVDSSVAAHLLLQQGYEVVGIFMRNWHDESVTINNECPWIDDSNDAILAAEHLGIPFQVLDLSAEYKKRIVDYMFSEYESGRTPNPDVLCNREIKFDIFLTAALNLKADYVATGHYCQRQETSDAQGNPVFRLIAGADTNKDQSYFLCQLSQAQLAKALFPIGHLTKPQVRAIADEIGLPNAAKKDSQGLCFIGKVKLPTFLQQQLEPKKGKVIELPASTELFPLPDTSMPRTEENLLEWSKPYVMSPSLGKVVGEHTGAHFYTIGQRRGLGVGGKAEPLFIVGTDVHLNVVYTGQGEHHPALYRNVIRIAPHEVHWVRTDLALKMGESKVFDVRIRYRQALTKAQLFAFESGHYLVFDEAQRGVAAGQFAAWYDGEELIGSGVIQ
jgi:tRNA-specific 2-thiouridylase